MTLLRRTCGVVLLGAAGCATQDPVPPFTVRDSAGITIAESRVPAWAAGEAWRLDPDPVFDIGGVGAEEGRQLFLVGDIVGFGDALAVVNAGSAEILVFDLEGAPVARLGGRGRGPREFTRLSGLYACPDSLLANDFDRIATIDRSPAIVRAERIEPASGERFVRVRAATGDCGTFVVAPNSANTPPLGEVGRRTVELAWGSLDGTRREAIGSFGMVDVQSRMVEDQPQPVALPWGTTGSLAYAGDAVHYSPGDRGEIRTYARSGDARIVRWPAGETAITAEDERQYGEMRAWFLEVFPQAEPMMPPLDDTPRGEVRPVVLSMLVDDAGNLWARRYPAYVVGRPDLFDRDVPMRYAPPRTDEPEVWTVFDPSGRWLGEVETPHDLVVRAIYRDLVIGVAKDALDVEHLRAHRLWKETDR